MATLADAPAPHGDHRAWVVVPVRSLGTGKQRLAGCLSAEQRQALCAAMLEDVLAEVSRADGVAGLLVVSADAGLLPRLTRHRPGALVPLELLLQTNTHGLNGAVAEAAQLLSRRGIPTMLVLHGDLPAVTHEEIERLLALHRRSPGQAHVTLVPDGPQQGTNALVASPPTAIPFAYGAGSFQAHGALATAHGATLQVMHSPALALDIDTPADLTELQRQCQLRPALANRHTGRLLAALRHPEPIAGPC